MNLEYFRELQTEPIEVAEIAQPLMSELGVDITMAEDPEQYIEQVRMTDPRYVNSKGEKRSISRQDVQTKAHLMTDDLLVSSVMNTADALGITVKKYPFDEFSKSVDAILVTSGVASTIEERTFFATEDIGEAPIFVVGGNRKTNQSDRVYLEAHDLDPDLYETEADLANLVVEKYRRYSSAVINSFKPRTVNPDNLDVIREFVLRNPEIGKLAIVTTALYVPFTSADKGTVVAEFGGNLEARVYAGESEPSKVSARTPDVYRSEIAKTLVSFARMHMAQQRRSS